MASSSSHMEPSTIPNSNVENDLTFYLPLHKAAIRGDWEGASKFFRSNPNAVTARITRNSETVLHIAVARSATISFVEKLVELIPADAFSLKNKFNETALHYAAKYGNIKAAKLLVVRDRGLPQIWNDTNLLPLHLAALFGQREMVLYLLTVTRDNEEPHPFADQPGITLLIAIVHSGFYGVPVKLAKASHLSHGDDVENLHKRPMQMNICWPGFLRRTCRRKYCIYVCKKLLTIFWHVIGGAVPQVKHIHDTKVMHLQAIELVKCLCTESLHVHTSKSASVFKPAIILAATNGVHEVLEEILSSFPSAIWCLDQEHHDLFQIAVIHRRESIFNLLYELDEHAHLVTQNTDIQNNNILHLAGKLAPPHRLNLVPGAALQIQRELQWYKEVEKFVTPSYKEKENCDGKTPAMVFAEEHRDLIAEGEQWSKDTAKSCTFAATLIATVVFAAAITVPGGSSSEVGLPIFQKQRPFVVFAVSNALSLFTSTTSVLMFLFILTSRCTAADFLYSLPNKLIIGLINLFLSLASMMVAFSSAMYAVFGHKKAWILAPITLLSCLPVTLFLFLQYPLLKDMIRSTYGPGVFGKQRRSTL